MRNPFKNTPKPRTSYVQVEKPEKKTFQRKVIDVSIEEALTATKEKVSDHFRNNWKLYVTHATTAVVAGTIGGVVASQKGGATKVKLPKQVARKNATIINEIAVVECGGCHTTVVE